MGDFRKNREEGSYPHKAGASRSKRRVISYINTTNLKQIYN